MSELSQIRLAVIRQIENYCTNFGVSFDALGRQALGDHKVCGRLRKNQGVQLSRVEILLAYIKADTLRRTAVGDRANAA